MCPLWLNSASGHFWDILLFQRLQQFCQSVCPPAFEVYILEAADPKQLLELLHLQWKDEVGVSEDLDKVFGNLDFLLNALSIERLRAATQYHFNRALMQRVGQDFPPPVSGIEAQDISKYTIPGGFKLWRKPKGEIIIARCCF